MLASRANAILALGVAFGVLGGQLAESAHESLAHVVCPEHGDTLHADRAGGGRSAPAEDQVHPASVGEGHEAHCGHAVVVAGDDALFPSVAPPTGPLAELTHPAARTDRHPIALLRLAPKASPPTLL